MHKHIIAGLAAAAALTALAVLTAFASPARAASVCEVLEMAELSRVGITAEVARGIEGDDLSIVVRDGCDIPVIPINEGDSDLLQSIRACKPGQLAQISGNIAQVSSTRVIVADLIFCA